MPNHPVTALVTERGASRGCRLAGSQEFSFRQTHFPRLQGLAINPLNVHQCVRHDVVWAVTLFNLMSQRQVCIAARVLGNRSILPQVAPSVGMLVTEDGTAGISALHGYACLHGYLCVQGGWTALYAAAREGHLECLKELLDRGAAVDHADKVRGACLCPATQPCCLAHRGGLETGQ